MIRAVRSVGAALIVAQLGCAGAASYQPRPSARIASVHINGRVYVRDGQRYEIGLLGGGGEALVASNDMATALMRKHHRKEIWGVSLFSLGAATSIAGNAMFWTADPGDSGRGRGLAIAWLGLVPIIASAVFFNSARHDVENAVNIYNDALEGPIAPDAFDPSPPPPGAR
jgi:hypothetical protein